MSPMNNESDSRTSSDRHTVTFDADSPIDGGWQERPRTAPPTELRYWAAVLALGAMIGCGMWCYLAIRLAFFSAIE